jgi:hypothetical protein
MRKKTSAPIVSTTYFNKEEKTPCLSADSVEIGFVLLDFFYKVKEKTVP